MFIIILVGFLISKLSILTEGGVKELTAVLMNVINPIVIFLSFRENLNEEHLKGLGTSVVLSAGALIIAFIISMLIIRKKDGGDSSIERFSAMYPNSVFMGIPLVNAVAGSEGVFYLTGFIFVFNLLVWSHGYIMLSPTKSFGSVAKALFSPTMISIYVSILFFAFKVKTPDVLINPMNSLAAANTPLAMLAAGATIAQADIIKTLFSPGVYKVSLIKLFLCPIAVMLIMRFLPYDETLKLTIVVVSAAPTAAIGTLMCVKQGQNAAYASQLFAVSTAFSIVTLPLIVKLYSVIG